ncbi:MAG: hypothetical protein HW400_42 [Candidatus Levybacteria bacterium]|nr:hypothetical protein [Candidatus Levybacteria bacterium]
MAYLQENIDQKLRRGTLVGEREIKLSSIPELIIHLKSREKVFFSKLKEAAEILRQTDNLSKQDVGYVMITRFTRFFTGRNLCGFASVPMFDALIKLADQDRVKVEQKTLLASNTLHHVLTVADVAANKVELIDPTYGQYRPLSYAEKILFTPFENLESLYPTDGRKHVSIVEGIPRGSKSDYPEIISTALTSLEQCLL